MAVTLSGSCTAGESRSEDIGWDLLDDYAPICWGPTADTTATDTGGYKPQKNTVRWLEDIPYDVRYLIYQHVFRTISVNTHFRKSCINLRSQPDDCRLTRMTWLNLSLTNRRVYSETMRVFLQEGDFSCFNGCPCWRIISRSQRHKSIEEGWNAVARPRAGVRHVTISLYPRRGLDLRALMRFPFMHSKLQSISLNHPLCQTPFELSHKVKWLLRHGRKHARRWAVTLLPTDELKSDRYITYTPRSCRVKIDLDDLTTIEITGILTNDIIDVMRQFMQTKLFSNQTCFIVNWVFPWLRDQILISHVDLAGARCHSARHDLRSKLVWSHVRYLLVEPNKDLIRRFTRPVPRPTDEYASFQEDMRFTWSEPALPRENFTCELICGAGLLITVMLLCLDL